MPSIIILDTSPLSNSVVAPPRRGKPPTLSQQCRDWISACERAGVLLLVPAIAYYEALREIERRNAAKQRERLREFVFTLPDRFLPLTTPHLEEAARYRIVIVEDSPEGQQIVEGQSEHTEWTPPIRLPRGKVLKWEVIALDGDGNEIAFAPKPPAPRAKFLILEETKVQTLERQRRAYPQSPLLRGLLDVNVGLFQEAEAEFHALLQANPESPVARGLLDSVRALRPPQS